jgi:hypothetical protein
VDLNKLSNGDRVVAGAGILFLISMFFPWWGIDTEFGSGSNSGWDYFLGGILPLIIVIGMIVCIAIQRFSTTELPALPLPWAQVYLIAGAVVALILVLRTAITSSEEALGVEFDLDRKWGMFVALIAALGVAAGGFLKFQEGEDTTAGASNAPPTPF